VRSTADVQVTCGGDQEETITETVHDSVCDTLSNSHRRSIHKLELQLLADYPDVHCMNNDCEQHTCLPTIVFVDTVTYTDYYDIANDCYTSDAKINGKILIHCTTCTPI
jgi:hypothetical protein